MASSGLEKLVLGGRKQVFKQGELVYSLDFSDELYAIKQGYIKRYSITGDNARSLQAIYGPGFFFPLTPAIKKLIGISLGEEHATYLYEALTETEIYHIDIATLQQAVEQDPLLYRDLLTEAGRRLRSNIHSLENNSLKELDEKIAHHLVYMGEEFNNDDVSHTRNQIVIPFRITAQDLADQLHVDSPEIEIGLQKLVTSKLLNLEDERTVIQDLAMLKDVYL